MSIKRTMYKEVVEHIHNEILITHEKEQILSLTEVDEPRNCDTE